MKLKSLQFVFVKNVKSSNWFSKLQILLKDFWIV